MGQIQASSSQNTERVRTNILVDSLLAARTQIKATKAQCKNESLNSVFAKLEQVKARLNQANDTRQSDISALKASKLHLDVTQIIGKKSSFKLNELYDLMVDLADDTLLGPWSISTIVDDKFNGVLISAHYGSIAPAILFKTSKQGFEIQSFHYDATKMNFESLV